MGLFVILIAVLTAHKILNFIAHDRLLIFPTDAERARLNKLSEEVEAGVSVTEKIPCGTVGYRDYKLEDWKQRVENSELAKRYLLGPLVVIAAKLAVALLSYPLIATATTLLTIASLEWPGLARSTSFPFGSSLPTAIYALLLLVIVTGIMSAVLTLISISTFGIPKRSGTSVSPALRERMAFIRVMMVNWVTAVAMTLACATWFQDFKGMDPSTSHLSIQSLIDGAYFAASTFTTIGFGDITAAGNASRAFVTLIEIQTFIVLGMLLTSLPSRMHSSET